MSQSEKKSKGSSLIMPLAIGGGLLLLFLGIKKAKAEGDGSLPALPEMDNNGASQIVPEAAPKYTDLVENEADNEGENEVATPNYASKSAPSNSYTPSADADDEEDYSGANNGYQPNNSIPKTNSATKWNTAPVKKVIGNGKPKIGMQQYSDQNRKAAKLNSMRSQSDQAKLAQQKARNNKPAFSPIPFVAKTQQILAQKNANAKIFPIRQGQTNNYIKEVQRKMGVSPTGFFGTQTRAALLKKYKASEISEALYKQIMTGKAATTKPIIPLKMKAPLVKRPIKILPKKKILVKKR